MTGTPLALAALAALGLAGSAFSQSTFLTEDFSGGVVPPAGWVEGNNGISLGWQYNGARNMPAGHAYHDDFYGANDNYLMSPQMDLTAATAAYVHAMQGVYYASYRDHHYVEVSLDNGATFTVISDDLTADGYWALEADANAYIGINGVNVSFHYTGDFASEWGIDDIVVNDQGPPPPPAFWADIPSTFVAASGYSDDFEGHAGVVPAHFGINALNEATYAVDPEAWCNIGQSAPCISAASGAYCLEMGMIPGTTNYHNVRNGLMIGMDGTGSGTLLMDFMAIDHGEETHTWDGVWVSDDGGATFVRAYGPWTPLALAWQAVSGVDLSAAGPNLGGQFHLLFCQVDNFPYGYLDGIGIDDISIYKPAPALAVSGLVAGGTATVSVANCTPGGKVRHGYSLVGGGPTATPFGDLLLSPPYKELPFMTADGAGAASFSGSVPAGTTGVPIWLHAFDLGSLTFTNGLAEVIG